MFISRMGIHGLRHFCRRLYHTTISDVLKIKKPGDSIEIKGWVKSLRRQKGVTFFDVNDGTHLKRLQVVIEGDGRSVNIMTGCSVIVKGTLNKGPSGELELAADRTQVIGECDIRDGYPFAPRKAYPSEYTRRFPHFRPRTKKFGALLRIRDTAVSELNNYLHSEGFIQIHTPILTSNDCEGAGEVFTVRPSNDQLLQSMSGNDNLNLNSIDKVYFDGEAFLSVSGQMHLEAVAHGLSKVYSFGPTFRAENSKSRYHLSEFYMLEAEMAFINNIEQLIEPIEFLIKKVSFKVFDKCSEEIAVCKETDDFVSSQLIRNFKVMSYTEAADVLSRKEHKFRTRFNPDEGLTKEHEIFLVYYCQAPVFIINWPKHMKPFYMKECPEDTNKVSALDLLGPNVGEIVGGSLREDDYDKLKSRVPGNDSRLQWYLDIRKFGGVPTAGFGLGFERFLQCIVGIGNIKDTIPFPRWPHHCPM